MPSINEFLTEVCYKHFYKIFTNNKYPDQQPQDLLSLALSSI